MKSKCPHPANYKCCCYANQRDTEEKPVDAVEEMNRFRNKWHGISNEDRYDEDSKS